MELISFFIGLACGLAICWLWKESDATVENNWKNGKLTIEKKKK